MSNLAADPGAPAKGPVKTIFNRGTMRRYYVLKDGRKLMPGQSLEVGLDEFKKLLNYKDLVDADKVVPGAAEKSLALKKENDRLRGVLAGYEQDPVIAERLKEIAAASKPPAPEPKKEKEAPKGKGK